MPQLSANITRFALGHDLGIRISSSYLRLTLRYDDSNTETVTLNNIYCLGNIIPEVNVTGKMQEIVMCGLLSRRAQFPQKFPSALLTGSLSYTVKTVQSVKKYHTQNLNQYIPSDSYKGIYNTRDYCLETQFKQHCRQCQQTCHLMVFGTGFAKCERSWKWYENSTVNAYHIYSGESDRMGTKTLHSMSYQDIYYHYGGQGISLNIHRSREILFILLLIAVCAKHF